MTPVEVLKAARKGTLSCSTVAALLADQPTAPGTSHAHMHMLDGFQVKLKDDYLSLAKDWYTGRARRAGNWNNASDAHLFPVGVSPLPTYDGATSHPAHSYWKTFIWAERGAQDSTRSARDTSYNSRSGLPEIPQVPEVRGIEQRALRRVPGQANPVKEPLGPSGVAFPPGTTAADWVVDPSNPNQRKVIGVSVVTTPAVPKIPGTAKHTMFADSETMVMHLTAALLSIGGKAILQTLLGYGSGSPNTVGLFSKTAVDAVNAKVAQVGAGYGNPQTLVRTADTTGPRASDGTAKLVGTFTKTNDIIDHVVVVMSYGADSRLVVNTCFPSPESTMVSIGTSNAPHSDITEHMFGQHTVIPVDAVLPALVW
jgi:hypothetical protein